MSSVLFNIYMDEFSYKLNQSYIGFSMNGIIIIINNLMCVYDTCINASSPSALQELVDIRPHLAVINVSVLIRKG